MSTTAAAAATATITAPAAGLVPAGPATPRSRTTRARGARKPKPATLFVLVFGVTVGLEVCAPRVDQARAGARRLILDDQTHLRDIVGDAQPSIGDLEPAGTDSIGRTRFHAEARLYLAVHIEGVGARVPWARGRKVLLADLGRLRQVRPVLATIDRMEAYDRDEVDAFDDVHDTRYLPDGHPADDEAHLDTHLT